MGALNADEERILFANDAFYAAFASGDVDAMDEVWAWEVPVVCIHPGATPIHDRAEIMRSWDHILSDPGVSDMKMHSPRVIAYDEFAFVTCYETLGGGALIALNGFILENGTWRMISHQAGPCPDAPDEDDADDDEAGPSLH